MARLEKPGDLSGWRDYARRLEARASRKIAQIKRGDYMPPALGPILGATYRSGGVDIARTGLDPRKGTRALGRMTKAQTVAHAHRLEEFMAPNVSYYPSASGQPISAKVMLRYAYAQRRANEKAIEFSRRVGGTRIPWRGGRTFADVFDLEDPNAHKGSAARGSAVKSISSPNSFTNEAAVRRVTSALNYSLTDKFDKEQVEGFRRNIKQLSTRAGDPEIAKILDLPDDVIRVMWMVDDEFISSLAFRYQDSKGRETERNSPADQFNADMESDIDGKDMVNYGRDIKIKASPEEGASGGRFRNNRLDGYGRYYS